MYNIQIIKLNTIHYFKNLLYKQGIEGNFLNVMKYIYPNIWKILFFWSAIRSSVLKIMNKIRIQALTVSISVLFYKP